MGRQDASSRAYEKVFRYDASMWRPAVVVGGVRASRNARYSGVKMAWE